MDKLVLILFLSGCVPCSQDPGLLATARPFFAQFKIAESNVCDINYGIIDEDTAGLAYIQFHRCDITIDPYLTSYQERATILHEVAHCVGLDHVSKPNEIMSVNLPHEYYLQDNWEKLIKTFKRQLKRHRNDKTKDQ